MDFYAIDSVPTLVRLARLDYEATREVLEYLRTEDKGTARMSTLLCLGFECGNSGFAYRQLDAKQYIAKLLLDNQPYNQEILNRRLEGMFVSINQFYRHKLKALVLFKHFEKVLDEERYMAY
jgi:hypothetical protein